MALIGDKNWDHHVAPAETIARTEGFRTLRDRIVAEAAPDSADVVVDIGAGTGLLALEVAPRVAEVWAVDISPQMVEYLRTKATSAGLENVHPAVASAVSLPFVDEYADLIVSNYCFHHLRPHEKEQALAEVLRVLRPGGRLVFGDMMFGLTLTSARDRRVVGSKVSAMLSKGIPGLVRLLKNSLRLLTGHWEHPARPDWWRSALERTGFVDVRLESLAHEGGIAIARRPSGQRPALRP
jgi:ubiquinone/menaquinone biosynthesis C-methylase UbiE